MRWRRISLVVAFLTGIVVLVYCGVRVWPMVEGGQAGFHQRSVKNEMATWEREHRTLHNWREAWNAACLLEYTRTYYVPGPGYRGSARTEAELDAQRTRTQEALAAGLHEFTGQDFGTDAVKWQEWMVREGHAEGR